MRTIKFRGKSVDYGTWRYGSLIIHEDGSMAITGGANEFSSQVWSSQVHPESVGQWTGLVYRHGKEIYEGDVVKAENTQNVGEIKYVHEHGAFLVYSHDENGAYYEYLDIGLCEKYFEIIGNIHDNPELMEV